MDNFLQQRTQPKISFSKIKAILFSGLVALNILLLVLMSPRTEAATASVKPTVVLVHGAFADSSSWNGVISGLLVKGYPVVAVANPLRGVQSDSNYVGLILDSIPGSVVLVGHSYGGNVITAAANGKTNVKALVYVAGLAPDSGESAAILSGKFPGSTLGPTLASPVVLGDGSKDLYIQQSKFHAQMAADVPPRLAAQMAVGQRPITEAALNELSGVPAWKRIPSWFIYGSLDKNIPPALQPFMASRAGAKSIVNIEGASHVVMTSHPDAVVKIIEEAAVSTADR